MAASSSSPSFENDAKLHPYQQNEGQGPRGAYEAKKLKEGLYVRVDMPGVQNDGVKVLKYTDARTVTFTGKSPKSPAAWWAPFDSSSGDGRVYGGYVVLDRDPAGVDVKAEVKNGCLRLFFPASDGSLHSLSPLDEKAGQDVEEKISDDLPEMTYIEHDPSGIRLVGGRTDHINPYQLSGVKGVFEQKSMKDEVGTQVIYVRLDAPGACDVGYSILESSDPAIILFSAVGCKMEACFRDDYDEREYTGALRPACACCTYEVVKHEMNDGVLRFLVRKQGRNGAPVLLSHYTLPPSRPGGPLRPSVFKHY